MTPLTIATKDGSKKERLLVITGSVKPSGMIVARVTTDKGDDYFVRLYTDGREECGCPGNREWHKRCYHIKEVALVADQLPLIEDLAAAPRKRAKFVPDLSGLQLPEGVKMRKVRGKSQLVIAAKPVKQDLAAPVELEIVAESVGTSACTVAAPRNVSPVWKEGEAGECDKCDHEYYLSELVRVGRKVYCSGCYEEVCNERIAASRKESEKRSQAPLNGNRGFSLMR